MSRLEGLERLERKDDSKISSLARSIGLLQARDVLKGSWATG